MRIEEIAAYNNQPNTHTSPRGRHHRKKHRLVRATLIADSFDRSGWTGQSCSVSRDHEWLHDYINRLPDVVVQERIHHCFKDDTNDVTEKLLFDIL